MNTKVLLSEKGQSLVVVALLMLGMLGMLGLVLDGGAVLMARRRSQDAADAAAFAGVRALATRNGNDETSELTVTTAIAVYATANGVAAPADVTATFIDQHGSDICIINQTCGGVPTSPLATGVRVTTTLNMRPYFITLLIGNQPVPVRAVAAAQSGSPDAVSNLMPMTLYKCSDPLNPDCTFTYGQEKILFGDQQTGGNFQWTNYSSPCDTTPGELAAYLLGTKKSGWVEADPNHEHMSPVAPPFWICGATGIMSNKTVREALYYWITKPEDERHWIIPVYDGAPVGHGSNAMYHVVMFADFVMTGYDTGSSGAPGAPGNYPPGFSCASSPTPSPTAGPSPTKDKGKKPTETPGPTPTTVPKKCIKGRFYKQAEGLPIRTGTCNVNGVDICGIGFSQ